MQRMVVFSVLALSGCGFRPLGNGDMGQSGDGAQNGADMPAPADLTVPVGGGIGPGPWGALPTGYCCASSTECRARNCVMGTCADECFDDESCNALPGYTCVGATQFDPGVCTAVMPISCKPASQFVFGGKKLGECCVATHDGMAGLECEGGRCGASGDINNPYICTNVCTKGSECPGNFQCAPLNNDVAICIPLADPYTCK